MKSDNQLLLASAAQLYVLGVDVEGAREDLRQLVAAGVPYVAPRMKAALQNFQELDAQWKELERQHLSLRTEMENSER